MLKLKQGRSPAKGRANGKAQPFLTSGGEADANNPRNLTNYHETQIPKLNWCCFVCFCGRSLGCASGALRNPHMFLPLAEPINQFLLAAFVLKISARQLLFV